MAVGQCSTDGQPHFLKRLKNETRCDAVSNARLDDIARP